MRSRKGGMIAGSSIHKHEEKLRLQREGYKNLKDGRAPSSAFQHIVNDNQEHQDEYGWNHDEDLNTKKEHDKWKEENPDVDPDQREVEDDPNVGAMQYRSPLKQGVLNRLSLGLLGKKKETGPQELLEGTGKTVEKVTGMKVVGGEGGEGDITTAGEGTEAVPPVEDTEAIV